MTVPMAIVDYIPVALFIAAAVLLQRDLYNKMSKGAFALFAAGTLMIMTAGLFKATWKLLYAMNVCDFVALNEVFLPMQAVGFLLTGAALIALLTVRQSRGTAYAVAAAPLPYTSGMIFIVLMVLGTARHVRKPHRHRRADEAARRGRALCGRVRVHAGGWGISPRAISRRRP